MLNGFSPCPTHQDNESSLVDLLKMGNQKAFDGLYDRFAPILLGMIRRIVLDPQQAEDLLQDSFVKIWGSLHSYDSEKGRLSTWVFRIARNTALDHRRTAKNVNQRLGDCPLETLGIVTPVYHLFDFEGWIKSSLSTNQGNIIDLVYFQGYTHQEIATELNLPLGTVKTHVRQALISLRRTKMGVDLLR